ncbi:LPXTG cell wall anchor domain-containing protein [Streptomyces sp. NBC_01803]|uniref:LPXTG cell wall anchor domain-containing protein n=1 Tax=Streptomyces sp. NBC_01803 TaxID=2975946 RepID=UPI002DDB89D3|nr:LPXTG cell wall anchor domain-containing protein [Streptomyces sp. NBC_01803]WSA44588.1 LPXTG cell wall anchor domain-containing protein [Streptomyces sp. NBC_01803]
MRKLSILGAVAAAATVLVAGAPPSVVTDHEVGLHQDDQLPISASDPEFSQGEDCPPIGADQDGWHFVLPGNSTTFVELRVTFEPGGEQVVTDFGPPSDKHAYVASEPGAELVAAEATVHGEAVDFRLSHTCPATETGTTGGEDATGGGEEAASGGGEESSSATGGDGGTSEGGEEAGASEGTTSEGTSGGDEPIGQAGGEEAPAAGEDAGGDLAETGSSVPVIALSAGAAALVAAGGYLALRRRNAAQG